MSKETNKINKLSRIVITIVVASTLLVLLSFGAIFLYYFVLNPID